MNLRLHAACALLLLPVLAVATSAACAAELDAATLQEARSATARGDGETAIGLYEQLLLASPDDVDVLNESARQLSWLGRYDAALERYDRVLTLDPGNRFARHERAKVLSWAGRYGQSAASFRALLTDDPADTAARLGLARSLSWSGDLSGARSEYLAILERHPGHGEATIGLAQIHAWSGDLREARRLYLAARAMLGDSRDADIGTAYLDLWEGAPERAAASARQLLARYPGDGEVLDLQRAAREAMAPWVSSQWEQLDDTDRNLLGFFRLEAGGFLPPGIATRLVYTEYDVRTAGEEGSIRSVQGHVARSLSGGHRLEVMLGADRLEPPAGAGRVTTDWGVTYRFPLGDSGSGWIAAQREPYRYSVPLIVNRILIDSFAAGATGRIGNDWFISGEVNRWETSDGNARLATDLAARRRWQLGRHTWDAGGTFRWRDWREDLDSGYFDPSGFSSVGLTARAFGPLSAGRRLDYDFSTEAGVQSFDFAGRRTSGDAYYLAVARFGWQLGAASRLEAYVEAGSYASQGSEDWRYTRAGARWVWRFGVAD